MFRSPLFYTILSFIISLTVVGLLMPALVCMDGWASPSVGNSGACSHHGGVNKFPVFLGMLVSFIIAIFVWKKTNKHQELLKNPENKVIQKAEETSEKTLSGLNKILYKIWNYLKKSFYKAPFITAVIGCALIVVFPPTITILLILGFVGYVNDN